MAQYDGSIRINTKIDTKGFKDGEKEIEAESQRMAESVSKAVEKDAKQIEKDIENLKDAQKSFLEAGGKKQSTVYQEYEKELAKLQNSLKSIQKTQDETEVADEHWNQLKIDVEEYAKSLKELQDQGKFFGDEDYDKVYLAWKNATDAVKVYQTELNKQTESEQAKIAEKEAKAAEKREAAQRREEEQAEKALQKENARIQKQAENEAKLAAKEAERQAKLQAEAAEEKRLDQIRVNATASNQQIIDLLELRKQLLVEITDLEKAGVGFGYQEYDDKSKELEGITIKIKEYKSSLSEVPDQFSKMRSAAEKAFSVIRTGLLAIGKIGKKAFSSILSMAKKLFSSIANGSKHSNTSLSGGLKTILRYGLGIRSVYALFNKIRSGIKEGFTNLMGYSDDFANSIQSVKNSMSTLGNQIAAAFAPIVQMVVPWINQLISALSKAMTYVAQFIATLTGSNTFIKATQIQDKYNKSLGGTAKAADKARGALAKFDDLDVLQKQDDSGGGGGGAAETNPADMFEVVPVEEQFKSVFQSLKDMWEQADFTELGAIIGEKIKSGLDSIDWNPIKEVAAKIGKSIGTLINGFVEVDGLADSIGRAIGEAINTGIAGINAFLDNTHWNSVGKFIGDGLNGLVNAIEWDSLGHFFAEKWNAIFEVIGEAARKFDWTNFGTSLAEGVNTWIKDFNWSENGAHLGELIEELLDTLISFLEETDWQALGNGVADFIGSIDWTGIIERLAEGIGAALGGLAALLWGLIEDAWNSVVTWWNETAFEDGQFTIEGLLNGIVEAFKSIGEWIKEHIFQPFIDGFKSAFGIHSPSTVMQELGTFLMEGLLNGIQSLVNAVTEIWEFMKSIAIGIWESVKAVISSVINTIKTIIVTVMNTISAVWNTVWNAIKSVASTVWGGIKSTISTIISGIQTTISTVLSAIRTVWNTVWTGLKTTVTNVFNGIWSVIKRIINSILGGIEGMANGVVNGVNAVINALNSIGFDMPDWLGGKSFRLNIPTMQEVSIPRLATGAVIRGGNPFMAILGDQPAGKTNIEAPLATIEQALENVMSRNGYGRESVPVNINLQYDGETFARLSISDILSELGRQGFNIDVLGVT